MERIKLERLGGSYFAAPKTNIQFIPSGCKTLDLALGGGWAEGHICNVIGDSSTGKTLLCIEAAANFINKYIKSRVKWRQTGEAFDENYAQAIGVDLSKVDFGDPLETIEDLFEDLENIIMKATKPILYIVDSLDSLSDRAEMERGIDAGSYGIEKHRKLSRLFRQFAGRMSEFVTLLIVSQVRARIGGFGHGPAMTPTGGFALKFYTAQRVMLAQTGTISKTISGIKRPYGIRVRAKVIKNKIGLAFRESEFRILFGYGIDDAEACVSWLAEAKALKDAGLSANGVKEYLKFLDGLGNMEYDKEIAVLQKAVTKRWYEVERSFLPTRRKY